MSDVTCLKSDQFRIAVIGLGSVELPLSIALAKNSMVVGFDIDVERVRQLRSGIDVKEGFDVTALVGSNSQGVRCNLESLRPCNFFMVAASTHVDSGNTPDLGTFKSTVSSIGHCLKVGDIVVFESTFYLGGTEDICVPLLESASGLNPNKDFHVGYSPERINPGDKTHVLENLVKVMSASNDEALKVLEKVYASIIQASVHRCSRIKVAEIAKGIGNVQRDLNIAFVNEVAFICHRYGISVYEVLEASKTKLNFLDFQQEVVGGHCIGVDQYYLAYGAAQLKHNSTVVLAGRKVRDEMPEKVTYIFCEHWFTRNTDLRKVSTLGFTFDKENCSGWRNTKVLGFIDSLRRFGVAPKVFDPWITQEARDLFPQVDFVDEDHFATESQSAFSLLVSNSKLVTKAFFSKLSFTDQGFVFNLKTTIDFDLPVDILSI